MDNLDLMRKTSGWFLIWTAANIPFSLFMAFMIYICSGYTSYEYAADGFSKVTGGGYYLSFVPTFWWTFAAGMAILVLVSIGYYLIQSHNEYSSLD